MPLAIALNNFKKNFLCCPFSIIQAYSMQLFINQDNLLGRANNRGSEKQSPALSTEKQIT